MLGIPLRYLVKHPVSGVADLAADPLQIWTTVHDTYVAQREQRGPRCPYESDPYWEQQLHGLLGLPWPCQVASEFWGLWPKVIAEMEAMGVRVGPESFQAWNDGDAGFVRAIWCLVRHMKPKMVVETGVAHGVTSRCILEALEKNGEGRLWSIDLPPLERDWRKQVGVAVGNRYGDRWSYIKGSSRLHLPDLLSRLGQIDLFIHDSLHSERNVRFELDRAWTVLRPNGAIVVDDVDANWGFQTFTQTFPHQRSMICDAEPIQPDLRRFNQKGLFGIILKPAQA
ncbi:class I SAM-dependent methyltransferase [Acidobacterium sp. S8]|uniref:class I SAM-dependent methyltransferase n=1 Tax=Acidobacterium sp. S8 TaxID=1641854 RepID=UPI00131AF9B8|nr:class I SAM-dependent methyltransferase [Acidobacterium sp. S8]